MKLALNLKGLLGLGALVTLVAGGVVYATSHIFDVDLPSTVHLGVAVSDPIQIFSGDVLHV